MDNFDKDKLKKLVEKAKKSKKVKTYSEFCETEESEKLKLSEEEIQYYTSKFDEGD